MISKSKTQTQKLAIRLAKKLLNAKRLTLHAKVIALHGDLGAGKTTFVQGFMRALGVRQHVTSPTFLIIRKYNLFNRLTLTAKRSSVYHLDLYRIHQSKELLDLGFKEIIKNPQNIVLIEWPERVKRLLPKDTIWINFEHGKKENERIIEVVSH